MHGSDACSGREEGDHEDRVEEARGVDDDSEEKGGHCNRDCARTGDQEEPSRLQHVGV